MTDPLEEMLGPQSEPKSDSPASDSQPNWLEASTSAAGQDLPAWLEFELPPEMMGISAPPDSQPFAQIHEADLPELPEFPTLDAPSSHSGSSAFGALDGLPDGFQGPSSSKIESPAPSTQTPLPNSLPILPAIARVPVSANLSLSGSFPKPKLPNKLAYGVVAKLSTTKRVYNFRVHHELPKGVRLISTEPKADIQGNRLLWNLGDLPAGHDFRIRVIVQPDPNIKVTPADLTTFNAVYSQAMEFQTPLIRPKLDLTVHGPSRLEVGQIATLKAIVENQGNWPLNQAKIEWLLPPNLESIGTSTIKLDSLAPNQPWSGSLDVRARSAGSALVRLGAEAQGFSRKQAEWSIELTEARLVARLQGPETVLLGETVQLEVAVSNPGSAETRNTKLTVNIPEGVELLEIPSGAILKEANSLSWPLGTILPGIVSTWNLKLRSSEPGRKTILAEATATGFKSEAEFTLGIDLDAKQSNGVLEQFLAAMEEETEANLQRTKPRLPTKTVDNREQHIVFTVAGTDYAIPIGRITEVGRLPGITPVPHVPDWMLGVANIRGDIVSLVDFRQFLGLEPIPYGSTTRMLVVRDAPGEVTTALVVDRVRGLRFLEADQMMQPTSELQDQLVTYLRGVLELQGRLLVVLDPDRLLQSPEIRQFEAE
jgi:chemotaxis signal transduction protein